MLGNYRDVSAHERILNVFHMRSLRKLLGTSWMSMIPKPVMLSRYWVANYFHGCFVNAEMRWMGNVKQTKEESPNIFCIGLNSLLVTRRTH